MFLLYQQITDLHKCSDVIVYSELPIAESLFLSTFSYDENCLIHDVSSTKASPLF